MSAEALGTIIKRVRNQQGLTQGQLATKAKVTRSWLSLVERGIRKKPERDRIERVANALRVPPETLWAAAGYRVEPLPIRGARTPDEIISELRESMPIMVPETAYPASAGPGAFAEVEYWAYSPTAEERRHRFVAVPVVGTCMEPRLFEGERIIVDKDASPKPGDLVVAIHDGETIIKQLEKRDGDLYLVALRDRAPVKVDESTRIIGVVKMVMRRP